MAESSTKNKANSSQPGNQVADGKAVFLEDNRSAAALQGKFAQTLPQATFVDKRPQALQLRSIREMMDGSQRIAQLRAAGAPMENSSRSKRDAAFGAMTAMDHDVAQAKTLGEDSTQSTQQPAPKTNNTGLPNQLKAGVESLSGMSLDHVKVHYNSSRPAQLNAHAYAQGSEIHLAAGQEKHLPHEAWHVVQQAQGRVKPTLQMKSGTPVNDDKGLEREADIMGQQALAAGSSPATNARVVQGAGLGMPVLQRFYVECSATDEGAKSAEDTDGGEYYYRWQEGERDPDRYVTSSRNNITGWKLRNLYRYQPPDEKKPEPVEAPAKAPAAVAGAGVKLTKHDRRRLRAEAAAAAAPAAAESAPLAAASGESSGASPAAAPARAEVDDAPARAEAKAVVETPQASPARPSGAEAAAGDSASGQASAEASAQSQDVEPFLAGKPAVVPAGSKIGGAAKKPDRRAAKREAKKEKDQEKQARAKVRAAERAAEREATDQEAADKKKKKEAGRADYEKREKKKEIAIQAGTRNTLKTIEKKWLMEGDGFDVVTSGGGAGMLLLTGLKYEIKDEKRAAHISLPSDKSGLGYVSEGHLKIEGGRSDGILNQYFFSVDESGGIRKISNSLKVPTKNPGKWADLGEDGNAIWSDLEKRMRRLIFTVEKNTAEESDSAAAGAPAASAAAPAAAAYGGAADDDAASGTADVDRDADADRDADDA
ncbi:DUF4157 domain-containing protein [Herbaspirillum chlorophenolicum]|uniref:DUF4157 domain-containing protein n=1 Tax=Herbaspirillum chlorophenolicum TaxID=211589 RepID=A0ABW8F3P0_9BURK